MRASYRVHVLKPHSRRGPQKMTRKNPFCGPRRLSGEPSDPPFRR